MFKTAEELKIEEWERENLIRALALLESWTKDALPLRDAPSWCSDTPKMPPRKIKFEMNRSVAEFECGTAMCIGGLVKAMQIKGEAFDPAESGAAFVLGIMSMKS